MQAIPEPRPSLDLLALELSFVQQRPVVGRA